MSKRNIGNCLLTGKYGPYVKSHIIPAAFTRPAAPGGMLFQHGSGRRAQKRRTSWYDQTIVGGDGEKILADIDDWAIKFLRTQKLVWSGFGPANRIAPDFLIPDSGPEFEDYGVRIINVTEPDQLRRFFMSLLWRASVSTLPEMKDI